MSASSPQREGARAPAVWIGGLLLILSLGAGLAFWGTAGFAQTALATGVGVRQLRAGKGEHPGPTDVVAVTYIGRLPDGRVFDATPAGQPAQFELDRVVPGFAQGIQAMRPGERAVITIPAALAYGERGAGDGLIPPNTDLTFEVELLAAAKRPAAPR